MKEKRANIDITNWLYLNGLILILDAQNFPQVIIKMMYKRYSILIMVIVR